MIPLSDYNRIFDEMDTRKGRGDVAEPLTEADEAKLDRVWSEVAESRGVEQLEESS